MKKGALREKHEHTSIQDHLCGHTEIVFRAIEFSTTSEKNKTNRNKDEIDEVEEAGKIAMNVEVKFAMIK